MNGSEMNLVCMSIVHTASLMSNLAGVLVLKRDIHVVFDSILSYFQPEQ